MAFATRSWCQHLLSGKLRFGPIWGQDKLDSQKLRGFLLVLGTMRLSRTPFLGDKDLACSWFWKGLKVSDFVGFTLDILIMGVWGWLVVTTPRAALPEVSPFPSLRE